MRIDVQKEVNEFVEAKCNHNLEKIEESETKLIRTAEKILTYKIPTFINHNQASQIMNFLCLDASDIKQECLYLLHISLHSYDPTKNVKFLTYYLFNVRRHIFKFVMRVDSLTLHGKIHKVSIHETVTDGSDVTLADLLVAENTLIDDLDKQETFERLLSHLSKEEKAIVKDMLDGNPKTGLRYTYRGLSKKHKKSTSSICKAVAKIIRKAKRIFKTEVCV